MAKILVVDDENEFAEMLSFRLAKQGGYEVVMAFDGEEGLAMAKKENPDLIILDVMMPKMNGYEVILHLKEDEKVRAIPIIVLTASTNPKTVGKFREAGVYDFMVKPVEPEVLMDKVKKALKV